MSNHQNQNSRPKGMRGPGGMGMRTGEKAKDFKGTMSKLLGYLKPYRIQIMFVILFSVASTILSILGPKILGTATTLLVEGLTSKLQQTGGIDFDGLAQIIIKLLIMYGISAVLSFIQHLIMSGVTQNVAFNLRKALSEKINKLPFNYFDKVSHGEVLSRVTNDVATIAQSLNQSLQQILSSIISIIGILVMMLSISWQLTLMSLVVVPLSAVFAGFIIKKSQRYFKEQQETLGQVNGHVEEMYGGHLVMKAFNGEERSIRTFNQLNDKLANSAWHAQFLSGLMQPVANFVGNIGYVGVCILGGVLATKQLITIGDIQAFIQYVRQFNQPIIQTAQMMNVLQQTAASAERVFEFLEETEQIPETKNPLPLVDAKGNNLIEGSVTFENVKFGYNSDKIIINDFSAHFKAGSKVAIVGPTGAGKTTIVKLLMRFYELNEGAIYVDGHNIKEFKRSDLRSIFGMVLQDAWLFNGSIMENIRYGKLGSTDEDVMKAADLAYVDHFIRTLEHGYQTEINEESSNISQGQKQLLTIARAILADPKVLILDEATSSVDTRTELLIQKGMNNLMKDRTSFIIAHRLSTIRDADFIIVMKEGDIVEIGNHNELMERDGFYATLYNSQFDEEEE